METPKELPQGTQVLQLFVGVLLSITGFFFHQRMQDNNDRMKDLADQIKVLTAEVAELKAQLLFEEFKRQGAKLPAGIESLPTHKKVR